MAAVAIEISGVLYNKVKRTSEPVLLRGMAQLIGLEVGGGPIIPQPGDPPGIWGPGDPRPQPPIANVPGVPPSIDPPEIPDGTPPGMVVKPPPADGGWGYVHPYGWAYFPGPGDAGPK